MRVRANAWTRVLECVYNKHIITGPTSTKQNNTQQYTDGKTRWPGQPPGTDGRGSGSNASHSQLTNTNITNSPLSQFTASSDMLSDTSRFYHIIDLLVKQVNEHVASWGVTSALEVRWCPHVLPVSPRRHTATHRWTPEQWSYALYWGTHTIKIIPENKDMGF